MIEARTDHPAPAKSLSTTSGATSASGPASRQANGTLVVIPTYNERENLETAIAAVLEQGHDVLVVDDASPDGTGDLATRLASATESISVLHRANKQGLGSAYREGFEVGLRNGYEFIVEMDADGSHDPSFLEDLIGAARTSGGLAIGSRYVNGGAIAGWGADRLLLSRMANMYCHLILGRKVRDWTSGYRCFNSRALEAIDVRTLTSTGFDLQIETAFRCLEQGIPVIEVPIRFKDRQVGKSKASGQEIRMALITVPKLRRTRLTRHANGTKPLVSMGPSLGEKTSDSDMGTGNGLQDVVVGVLVHNEEATVEACLRAILDERDGPVSVPSIVVVASGCTDGTVDIVERLARIDPRIRLIVEPTRTGKVSAINLLLQKTSAPLVVTLGGDMVFTKGSLVRLLEPFSDATVGMAGVRPVPTNPRRGVIGNLVNILWDLHHELSLRSPKLGEAVAFRRIISGFEPGTVFDEATMERIALAHSLSLRYVPEATVRNRGPETLQEYVRHRTRNIREHLAIASATGYRVSTLSALASFEACLRLRKRGEKFTYLVLVIALEAFASARAHISLFTGRAAENVVWRPISTSKRVVSEGHVLRAHFDEFQTIRVGSAHTESALARRALDGIGSLIRAEDRVRFDRGRFLIRARGDVAGAQALCERLQQTLPHVLAVPTGEFPTASQQSTSQPAL